MMKWINSKLGTRFWYPIKITYYIKDREIFSFTNMVGFRKKNDILNYRKVAQLFHHGIYNKKTKHLLKNGYVIVQVYGYLGWFKKLSKKTK